MRILIYNGDLNPPTFIKTLANKLGDRGHDVYLLGRSENLFIFKKGSLKYVPCGSSQSPHVTVSVALIVFLKLLLVSRKLFKVIRQMKYAGHLSFKNRLFHFILNGQIESNFPQLLHIQWASHISEFKYYIENPSYKVVVSLRGRLVNVSPLVDPSMKALYENLFPQVDGFHAVSEAIGQVAIKYGARANRVCVVYSGVDEKLLEGPLIEKSDTKVTNIISVGRFHWKKGYSYALDACKILKEKNFKFSFTIIAKGESEEIKFQIKDLQLENETKVVNGLPHTETVEAIRNADLFLLPSVEEGIANVVLEAMAVGTFVISTDCGGMAELIKDEINGFLVPIRNPTEIAKKVLLFHNLDKEVKRKMIDNGRDTIVKKHLSVNQISNMVSMYQEVLRLES